ncbi:MAG: nucleotidyl transferase AbiEii/AbiGii toxin family protein [Actinomycetes bacterium]
MRMAGPVPDTWEQLFRHALRLLDDLQEKSGTVPFWTFGGGTVLMLRYRHRISKDIDIFVPDPQYLGYVNPRLSDLAESISPNYVEAAGYVKLVLPSGEIDFVAAHNLTDAPFEEWELLGRKVRVETAVEIIAKKMWHRGDQVAARDLFDLALAIQREPAKLTRARAFLMKHREAFLAQLASREAILRESFDAIDALDFNPAFDECAGIVKKFLTSLK